MPVPRTLPQQLLVVALSALLVGACALPETGDERAQEQPVDGSKAVQGSNAGPSPTVPPTSTTSTSTTVLPPSTTTSTTSTTSTSTTVQPPSTTSTTTTSTTLPPPPPTESMVSVKDHGASGDGVRDDTAAIEAAFAAAAGDGSGVHFPRGTYRLSEVIDIPDAVRVVDLDEGALVRQHDDDSAFQKVGDVADKQYTVTEARRGKTAIELSSTDGLEAGDWFYFGSDDVFHSGKGFKRGFLRRIVSISGSTVTIDRSLHHTLTDRARGWEVDLAPSVEFRGGTIEQHDPKTKFHSILHFELVRDPVVSDTEIRNCGAAGIKILGTVGGVIDTFIHDCIDDEGGARLGSGRHYGYGVEVTGATRDLVVRGTATRVRHAFTTNGAYGPHSDKRLLLIGEPEDVVVSMDVWKTTSSGLDTHEPGWNIQFRDCRVRDAGVYKREGSTSGKEGGFGMFIRARGTVVDNCVIERSAEDGLVVASAASGMSRWAVADGPVVRNVVIGDTEGKRGTHFYQPAHVRDLTIDGAHLVGMHMSSSGAGSTATDVAIDLRGFNGSFGVIDPEYLQMTNVTIRGATRQSG